MRLWAAGMLALLFAVACYLVVVDRSDTTSAMHRDPGPSGDREPAHPSRPEAPEPPRRRADLEEAVRTRAASRERPREDDVPDVLALDDAYPGARSYEQFKSSVEQNPAIRRKLRRCMTTVPEGTTDVAYRS